VRRIVAVVILLALVGMRTGDFGIQAAAPLRCEIQNAPTLETKVAAGKAYFSAHGTLKRSAEVRLLRDNVVIYTGKVGSLRRFKDDVSEVKQGFECGIGIANFNDLKEGDVIEFFVLEKVAVQTL